MEDFLNKYLLLANKTTNIIFNIGKNINTSNNNIIDTRCSIEDITKLVNYVKSKNKNIEFQNMVENITTEFQNIVEYRHDNRVYMKKDSDIFVYEEKFIDSYLDNNIYITRVDLEIDNIVPISLEHYDNKLEYELMTMSINNLFTVEIRNYNKKYYTFRIVVKKPNSKSYILGYLEGCMKSIA